MSGNAAISTFALLSSRNYWLSEAKVEIGNAEGDVKNKNNVEINHMI